MRNERKHERKQVNIDIGGSISKIEGFSIISLSQSGIQIESLEMLRIGSEYLLNINLSESETISLKAEVVRCTLIGSKANSEGKPMPFCEVGLKFIEPDIEYLKRLSTYISREELQDKQPMSL